MSNENSIESQHKGVMATSESSIQKLSDQFENSRHDSYDSGTTSNDCFSPCVIAQWVKRIKEENSPFHERDTIEHVIVPILHCLGYDVNSPSGCCLVRDNNDFKSGKQNWDLNLCQICADKTVVTDAPLVVIEAKSSNVCFDNEKWGTKDAKKEMVCWFPKLLDNDTVKLFRRILDDEECREEDKQINDKQINAIKSYVMGSDKSEVPLFDEWIKEAREELKSFFDTKPFPQLFDTTFNQLSGLAKEIVFRICTKRSNPTDDYFGQIWRYCMDGKHAFNRETTKVVWTNGGEWILFKEAFYDLKAPPKIVWNIIAKDFDTVTKEKYLTYYKLPEFSREDTEFDLKWNKVIGKLKAVIGPNG